jgi:hypothetical protein
MKAPCPDGPSGGLISVGIGIPTSQVTCKGDRARREETECERVGAGGHAM